MSTRWIWILGLLCPLLACAANAQSKPFSWRYGTGTNIDSFCTTKAEFYWQGKKVVGYPGGGCNAGVPHKNIINQKYYWAGGGGLPTDGVPVPDKAVIEMVSFHDRKRYRIKVDLPTDLQSRKCAKCIWSKGVMIDEIASILVWLLVVISRSC